MSNLSGVISSYNNLTGSLASVGGLSGTITIEASIDANALIIINAMTTTPDAARQVLIDAWVVAGKAHGWWINLVWWHMYASHANDSYLLNWKNPGTYDGIPINAPNFTIDRGVDNIGLATAYINSQYNTNLSTITDSGYGVGCATNIVAGLKAAIGASTGVTALAYLFPKYSGGMFVRHFGTIGDSAHISGSANSIAHMASFRNGASNDIYINKTKSNLVMATSSNPNLNVYVLGRNLSGLFAAPLGGQSRYAFYSTGMSTAEWEYLVDDTETFLDAIGAGLI